MACYPVDNPDELTFTCYVFPQACESAVSGGQKAGIREGRRLIQIELTLFDLRD